MVNLGMILSELWSILIGFINYHWGKLKLQYWNFGGENDAIPTDLRRIPLEIASFWELLFYIFLVFYIRPRLTVGHPITLSAAPLLCIIDK